MTEENRIATTAHETLSRRPGPRPATTRSNPQMQLDQQPDLSFSDRLIAAAKGLRGVVLGPSNRAPFGTVGFHLRPQDAGGPQEAFLLGYEFAHVHPGPDHSLHMILPEPLRAAALDAGWAEPHPMAGRPTISPLTVLVYAPRNEDEAGLVISFIEASKAYAEGR